MHHHCRGLAWKASVSYYQSPSTCCCHLTLLFSYGFHHTSTSTMIYTVYVLIEIYNDIQMYTVYVLIEAQCMSARAWVRIY